MPMKVLFWVLMLLWLVFGLIISYNYGWTFPSGMGLIQFLAVSVVGWRAFGAPIQGQTMRSAYDVLGIPRDADTDCIKKAFHTRAKILHPDVNKSSTATVEFQELNKAFETLKDDFKRQEHDHAILKAATKEVPDDMFDDVLSPKKKKKKRKKKKSEDSKPEPVRMPVQQPQVVYHVHNYPQPQVQPQQAPVYYQQPPQQPMYDPRTGQGYWEGVPDGYGADDSCGGVF